tara:strand:+ start:7504 stop:8202 length:699 start_codon:yes stop_codon:yes gene_type:complete
MSQENELFKVSLNGDFISANMKLLNDRINDKDYIDTSFYNELDPLSFSEVFDFGISITHQPFKCLDFGIYGSCQLGSVFREIRLINYSSNPNLPNDTTFGKRHFDVRSLHVGVTSDLIIHQMDFWKNTVPYKKLELSWNFRMGCGSSYLYYYDRFESGLQNDKKSVYNSNGIQLASGIKLGFIITNRDYFSSFGIKFGYQYYRTESFIFPYEEKIDLDFSGFTVGLYLSIGR